MEWTSYLIVLAITAICQLACRVLPVLLLANRQMPERLTLALDYIPVAAFAALVVNSLFDPTNFSAGPAANLIPLVAIIPVIIVARKTKSLWLCIVVGVIAYAIIQWFTSVLL
jgi:branched-subunit amino acid transport protein